MDSWMWLVIVGLAVLVVVAVLYVRRSRLRERFGPEYDRTVEAADSRRDAEHALRGRLRQHRKLELRPLSPAAIDEFTTRWTSIQTRFIDAPADACADAERLLDEVLSARGYPIDEDFDTQADLVSVDHPTLVQDYRSAHEAYHRGEDGPARTEALREAFVAYRGLFADVLGGEHAGVPAPDRGDDEAAPGVNGDVDRDPAVDRGVQDSEPEPETELPKTEPPETEPAQTEAAAAEPARTEDGERVAVRSPRD